MVDWVRANRASLCHEVVLDSLTLTRFRYRSSGDRHLMAMEPWHAVALEG